MDNQNEAPQQVPLTELEQLKLANIRMARELERTRIRASTLAIGELDRAETSLGDEINARLRAESAMAAAAKPAAADELQPGAAQIRDRVLAAHRGSMVAAGEPVDAMTEGAILEGQIVSRGTSEELARI